MFKTVNDCVNILKDYFSHNDSQLYKERMLQAINDKQLL